MNRVLCKVHKKPNDQTAIFHLREYNHHPTINTVKYEQFLSEKINKYEKNWNTFDGCLRQAFMHCLAFNIV
jgi:hypothetical protein